MRIPRSTKIAVPVLALGFVLVCSTAPALGQAFGGNGGIAPRGVPASVTSFGFGGRPGFHGVPASVTSQGFGAHGFHGGAGFMESRGVDAWEHNSREHNDRRDGRSGFRHHRRYGFYSPFYGGYYNAVPYAYPYYLTDEEEYVDDPGYDPRATRDYADRQQLNEDYRAEVSAPREQQTPTPAEPVVAQPSTVLIFKDGHQQEVANYAIVGSTLYELSDGRSKKVQLDDLDLQATVKENDERGVEFQLPAKTALN